ncbi:hypothetical protein D3C80_1433990 [compost metagenome]
MAAWSMTISSAFNISISSLCNRYDANEAMLYMDSDLIIAEISMSSWLMADLSSFKLCRRRFFIKLGPFEMLVDVLNRGWLRL